MLEKVFKPSQTKSSLVLALILILVIDVPLLFVLVYSFQGFSVLFVILLSVLLLVDGLIMSLSFLGKRMSYKIQDNNLLVNFGWSKRKIPYSSIRDVKLSKNALLFRLFGASWPGLYWGLYTTKDLGKVWAYSTKMTGDFVMIELVDGNKILVSPENPSSLYTELKNKRNLFGTSTAVEALVSSKRLVYLQVASVACAFFFFLGYLLWIYPSLPETIPVHFDLNMVPNRWGHKSELFIIAAIAAIFPVINSIFVLKFGKYGKTLTIFLGLTFILLMAMFLAIVYFTQSII